MKHPLRPKHTLAPIALLLAMLPGAAGAASPKPAHVRRVQCIASDSPLSVTIEPVPGSTITDSAEFADAAYASVSSYRVLTPGRYKIQVKRDGHTLLNATYGLGVNGYYSLTLFGLAPDEQPHPQHTTWATVKRIFGGTEAATTNGYLPQVRMLRDRVRRSTGQAHVRVMHAAAGLESMKLTAKPADGDEATTLTPGVTYPKTTDIVELKPGRYTLEASLGNCPIDLAGKPKDLEAGTLTTVWLLGGINKDTPLRIITATTPVAKRLTDQ